MKELSWKRLLPYAPLPVAELALLLFLLHRGAAGSAVLERMVLTAFGYVAAVGDWREKRVLNSLVKAMLGAWILVTVPQLFYNTDAALSSVVSGVAGAAAAGVIFLVVYIVSRHGLGGGDVKFMTAAGLYIGLGGVFPVMFIGAILAGLTGLALILAKRIDKRGAVPLIPFLYVGILFAVFLA